MKKLDRNVWSNQTNVLNINMEVGYCEFFNILIFLAYKLE